MHCAYTKRPSRCAVRVSFKGSSNMLCCTMRRKIALIRRLLRTAERLVGASGFLF